jgi:hypothetical protein
LIGQNGAEVLVLHAEEDEIDSKSAEDKVLSLLKAALEEDDKGQEPKNVEVREEVYFFWGGAAIVG